MTDEIIEEKLEKKNPEWTTLGVKSTTKELLDATQESIKEETGMSPTFDELLLMMIKAFQEKRNFKVDADGQQEKKEC